MQCTVHIDHVAANAAEHTICKVVDSVSCVGAGLEDGLSSMVKGETAVVSCPAEYATDSTLLPRPPDHPDRVEFELHLLTLAQVCL